MNHNRGRKRNLTGDKMPYFQRYSVYHKNTDMPLIVYATAAECAAAMGIRKDSFYRYIVRKRSGITMRKWVIYVDEIDEIEEENE